MSRNLEDVSPPAALTADLPAAVPSLTNPVATAPATPAQAAPATPPAAPAQACSAFTGCPEGTVLNQLAATAPQVAGQEQATCCMQQVPASQALVTTVNATAAPTAVDPSAVAPPKATVAATSTATADPSVVAAAVAEENTSFISRHWPSTVAVTSFLLFFFVGYLAMPAAERSKATENFVGHPFSWLARSLGMILCILYLYFSIPVTGYIFGGCFYLSIHGLGTTVTLAGTSLPQWFDVLNIPAVPKVIKRLDVGLKVSTSALGSAAVSGFLLPWWLGDPECGSVFFHLSIWLGIAAMFFGFAWVRGEGGGLMGLMRGRGVSGSG